MTHWLTQPQIVELLKPWAAHDKAIDAALAPIAPYLRVENPLTDAVWKLFGEYTRKVAESVGDESEGLNWYRYENGMGANGMEAGETGKPLRSIRTLEDLAWLIAAPYDEDPSTSPHQFKG